MRRLTKENHTPRTARELLDDCDDSIALLTERIDYIRTRLNACPSPDECNRLAELLDTLREERRNLTYVSLELTKIVAPPPPNPSLAARERECR